MRNIWHHHSQIWSCKVKAFAMRRTPQYTMLQTAYYVEDLIQFTAPSHPDIQRPAMATGQGYFTTAPFGSRPWHDARDAGFTCIQNIRVTASGRLPLRFQGEAWKARHCAPECEAVKVKSKIQWSFQDIEKATNLEYLRKVTRREQRQPKREATGSTTQWDHSSPLAFICHHKLDLASGHVWNYRI